MESSEEAALLGRLQQGDEAALAALYSGMGSKVFSLALQLLGSREEAEEVMQDTFLKVYRQARTYRADLGSPRAFVYTIARNDCMSRLRARRARPQKADWDVHELDSPLPSASVDGHLGAVVTQALAQLEPLDRQLLHDSFYAGYTHLELAERSKLPLGTVKSRVRRALLALERFLEQP
ncbi:sigma-70 family RNA polymerase sigma factor [Deinococcus deserti]|uniref:Putative RNA polymerase, sigma-24 subunit, ECF subfamily n=1 Tax=Deinococcus deserti (strain DSM 17065 / CIP 109153 / LMG 22923 / VCD115) TaxID=546414 RepID=C1D3Q6_DEIDV|nr:sigma-70 family RNA polymerase sigma factor [Deinococcus deserti]ACO48135.1 putative RNA polymerase, sigma-24 subunit, ECF subfamily [Deinococcus deserti VCD115]